MEKTPLANPDAPESDTRQDEAEKPSAAPIPELIAKLDDEAKAILALSFQDFFARTCVEIGVMLRQLGRRAAEVKLEEIQKFSRTYDVHCTRTPAGALRYEMTIKGKAPSWAAKPAAPHH